MKEAKWLTGNDLDSMLELLHRKGRLRTLRLFAVALCRRFVPRAKVPRLALEIAGDPVTMGKNIGPVRR